MRKKESLQIEYPEIAKEWHPTKNGDLKPTDITSGSEKKVWWICEKGHEWQAFVKNRINGSGCPICANKTVLAGYNDLASLDPLLTKEWHLMYRCESRGIIRRKGFLYLQNSNDKIKFRIPGDRRDIKYISIEELADGFYTVIEQNISVSREGLYRTMTNLLGFNRTGDAIVSRFDETVTYLKQNNMIIEEDSVLKIVNGRDKSKGPNRSIQSNSKTMPREKFCTNCGMKNQYNNKFCIRCGQVFSQRQNG